MVRTYAPKGVKGWIFFFVCFTTIFSKGASILKWRVTQAECLSTAVLGLAPPWNEGLSGKQPEGVSGPTNAERMKGAESSIDSQDMEIYAQTSDE